MSFLNIAHRGASRDAPENTLEAFRLAIEQGAHMIETDLHPTRDGCIVIYHDAEIEGEAVGGFGLQELRERLPSLPTLEETLEAFGEQIPFNLELKYPKGGEYPELEAQTLDHVRSRGLLGTTLFSSFHQPYLERLRGIEPDARIGLLISGLAPHDIDVRAQSLGAEAVHLPLVLAQADRIGSLKAQGFRVYVFTVDKPEDQERLIAWGVDGLFTNVPAQLGSLLDAI